MVSDLKILVRVLKYLNQCTILCCIKNPVTHTHTHTLRVQTLFSHSDKSPKQTKTETTQQGSHRQKFPRPEVIRCYRNQKTLHETIQPWLTLVNCKYMMVCIYFQEFWSSFLSTFYGQLGPKFSANVLKNMVPDINVLVRVLKYLNQCTILCCTKNPVTHTHTHTASANTALSLR